jgi:hypothetical protein
VRDRMGRCGISPRTRPTGLLGVDLGPAGRMLPADENDNARGYWEQRELCEVNMEIMAAFVGTWDPRGQWPTSGTRFLGHLVHGSLRFG